MEINKSLYLHSRNAIAAYKCSIAVQGSVVQLVRMPPCHGGGRGFESRPVRKAPKRLGVLLLRYCRVFQSRQVSSIPEGMRMHVFFVYIIRSECNGSYYVGQTADVVARLARHNSGSESATAPYVPWALIWQTEKPTRSEAVQLERKLKNLSRVRLEAFVRKYGDG